MTSPKMLPGIGTLRRHLCNIVFCMCCCALSLWSVRAVLNQPATAIPTSIAGSETVPLFNVWTIVWNALQFRTGFAHYWDAPIFFPQTGSFAFSEPQPATLLMAPLILICRAPALAANAWLILSLTLNGLLTSRLLSQLNVSRIARHITGAAVVLLPMVHDQLDVLQLVPLWPTLWTWSALIGLSQTVRLHPASGITSSKALRQGLELGVAIFFAAACSIHHFLFLSLLLACTGWILLPLSFWRRWLPGALVALSIALLLLLPILIPMSSRLRGRQFERTDTAITQLSARAGDLLKVSPSALIRTPGVSQSGAWFLCPGWVRLIIAGIAVGSLRHRPPHLSHRHIFFLTALAGCAALWSMGTNLVFLGWKPWTTLSSLVPGFSSIRSVFRFGYFFQLALLLLSGIGLDQLVQKLRKSTSPPALRCFMGVVLSAVMIFEVPPEKVRVVQVPAADEQLPWLDFLQTHRSGGKGVLLLPYPATSAVDQYAATTRWMIQCTLRGIPIANGYSGFFPDSHFYRQQQLATQTLSAEFLQGLQNDGVEFLVIFPTQLSLRHDNTRDIQPSSERLKLVWQAPDQPRIFQLQTSSPSETR